MEEGFRVIDEIVASTSKPEDERDMNLFLLEKMLCTVFSRQLNLMRESCKKNKKISDDGLTK